MTNFKRLIKCNRICIRVFHIVPSVIEMFYDIRPIVRLKAQLRKFLVQSLTVPPRDASLTTWLNRVSRGFNYQPTTFGLAKP